MAICNNKKCSLGECNQPETCTAYVPVITNADRIRAMTQEWISVDDRLPNDNDRVIAFRPNEPETSAYKYCVMWGWSVKASLKHRGITHLRQMPQPPKGE